MNPFNATKQKGLRITILGSAKSGIAAAELLHINGHSVFISDSGPLSDDAAQKLQKLNIPFEENGHNLALEFELCDLLVISPAILLSDTVPLAAARKGVPIVSEVEVASWFLPENSYVLAITGTNGKSTTTHYATQVLQNEGYNAVSCGNIGTAFCQAVLNLSKDTEKCGNHNASPTYFVVELSSYQLETTYSLQPTASVFLNLQEDHLKRYQNMNEYLKAKWRLVLMTNEKGIAIIHRAVMTAALKLGLEMPNCQVVLLEQSCAEQEADIDTCRQHLKDSLYQLHIASNKRFSSQRLFKLPKALYQDLLKEQNFEKNCQIYFQNSCNTILLSKKPEQTPNAVTLQLQEPQYPQQESSQLGHESCNFLRQSLFSHKQTLTIEDSILPGIHNAFNICAASVAVLHLGVKAATVLEMWKSASSHYKHLAHRLEFCGEQPQRGVRFFNDSKATNVESTITALASFSSNVLLLIGGEPKGESFKRIADLKCVSFIMPFGKAFSQIVEELSHTGKVYAAKQDTHVLKKPLTEQLSTNEVTNPTMLEAAALALKIAPNNSIILLSPACASFDEFRNFEHRGDIFKSWVAQKIAE